ncbi:5-methylcytosine-specific restriction enzyme A [Mucilaginibacter pineti]|uniref:5-methylcytosine-specific restriction enzyme A n=1 Tax=Mucilaginibacter pineti TaxID=1391627 RepID=A0A1G7FP03_9SPHI|nr:DUF3578 domain-containing protein [Mucilaginibacter pineti]SDE77650.1 5-methylcytosine-specific restriction enzyme A [Mucilaginibacter pineti]
MKELFQNLLSDYQEAYNQPFAEHPLGKLISQAIPNAISKIITQKERYIVKGSNGKGNWTASPWIAIFDILITNTAQSGYYPVFLFRDDMSGFYLSLNQGVTDVKERYKRETKQVLKLKAEDFRAQIGMIPQNFSKIEIKLRTSKNSSSTYSQLYEAGNIVAKFYSAYDMPTDEQLQVDVKEILKIYELITYNEGLPTTPAEKENDEESYKGFEELRRFRFHKRIERNIQLSKKVKELQGYNCKVCNINFEKKYGVLGRKFIEAHHLKPIHKLLGEKIELDAKKDFTVLCSNCHSMIHKLDDPSDIEALKKILQNNN